MTKTIAISLGDEHNNFIEAQIASGRFASASEVINAALRLLEERERALAELHKALDEGLNSGPPEPFDVEEFLAEKNAAQDA